MKTLIIIMVTLAVVSAVGATLETMLGITYDNIFVASVHKLYLGGSGVIAGLLGWWAYSKKENSDQSK